MELNDEEWERFLKKLKEPISEEKRKMLLEAVERGKKIKEYI